MSFFCFFDKKYFFVHIKYKRNRSRLVFGLCIGGNYMKWKLAACRINKGLKQKEVAELMHTSNTTIVNHETGKVKPTIAQKKMYSEIYGVPEDDIDCEIRK
jgi:DNA-binding XRE family transcriptional regulator